MLFHRRTVSEFDPERGRRFIDERVVRLAAPAARAFAPVQRIGGKTGWYYGNILWRLRGLADVVVGGVGMRLGRRDDVDLQVGDHLDFWTVEDFEQDRLLRLVAEMKLPGRAWLEFEVSEDEGGTTVRQRATFYPTGIAGRLYWYLLYPVHHLIFEGMLRNIARAVGLDDDEQHGELRVLKVS